MRSGRFIISFEAIARALSEGKAISKILIQKGLPLDVIADIKTLSKRADVPIQMVPVEKLDRLARGKHQGVIAIRSAVNYYRLESVLPMVYERGEVPLFLALDGVTDVRNVGAIARTVFGAGVHAMIIPSTGTAPLGDDAQTASSGTLSKITVCRHPSIHGAVSYLHLNGIKICSADSSGTVMASEVDFRDPVCLVIGDEEEGVSKAVKSKSDQVIRLPISRELDSYNVSVAVGMLLYEVMRQRGAMNG